jgi:hypothetical protein
VSPESPLVWPYYLFAPVWCGGFKKSVKDRKCQKMKIMKLPNVHKIIDFIDQNVCLTA